MTFGLSRPPSQPPDRAPRDDRFTKALAQALRTEQAPAVMSLHLDRSNVTNDRVHHNPEDDLLPAAGHWQHLQERDHYGHIRLRRRATGRPDIPPCYRRRCLGVLATSSPIQCGQTRS